MVTKEGVEKAAHDSGLRLTEWAEVDPDRDGHWVVADVTHIAWFGSAHYAAVTSDGLALPCRASAHDEYSGDYLGGIDSPVELSRAFVAIRDDVTAIASGLRRYSQVIVNPTSSAVVFSCGPDDEDPEREVWSVTAVFPDDTDFDDPNPRPEASMAAKCLAWVQRFLGGESW